MAIRRIPIRRVGSRSNLFMGGDRELVMMSGLFAFAMIFTAQTWISTFFGVFLWMFALYVFRLMAKADPRMRDVYMRHRRYVSYYPPRSTPFRENSRLQWKQYQ